MTHEQFIKLETARLAKQAGYDWEVNMQYYHTTVGWQLRNIHDIPEFIKGNDRCIPAPTQSVLQRWLRDVKEWEVYVEVKYGNNKEYVCRIETSEYGCNTDFYSTYEAALEAGLQECLTILIEKK